MRMPGSTPATNRSSTETSATMPYRINGSDGANNRPKLPDEVINPKLKRSS